MIHFMIREDTSKKISKRYIGLLIGALILIVFFASPPVSAATYLNGRILLQVQDKGQAWYVNPVNGFRYYLGRPDDAFNIMRSLGLGVSNADLAKFKSGVPSRLAGRILLQVQDKGQAFYVSPTDLKLSYLGRAADAFSVMRSYGLGITNADLIKIRIASVGGMASSAGVPVTATGAPTTGVVLDTPLIFSFKYKNNPYTIQQNFSSSLYFSYRSSIKVYSYSGTTVSDSVLREAFYALFLNVKSGDNSISDLVYKLKATAFLNSWTDDEIVEFALALVQYIPYDSAKLADESNRNLNPYYPYETLYLDRGVCSDKTFLAVALLRQLGYGAAILDFPTANHSAVGVACPIEQSLNASGYCYGETTNYFPIGVVPPDLNSGQAQSGSEEFTGLFNGAHLGTMEIYQRTNGKIYLGVATTRALVDSLKINKDYLSSQSQILNAQDIDITNQETEISALKVQMDLLFNNGQTAQYNSLVSSYNTLVNKYNQDLSLYRTAINDYNQKVLDFNQSVKYFYQK